MRIQNNIMALNTHRMYGVANGGLAGSAEKLSSGYRINRAGDDAAGLAISEKMRAQIRGLTMASKNSQDAISMIQTAEGALQSTHNILQRMRELAVQSSSDTNEQVIDRGALDAEFDQLLKEINDTASKTRFNDQNLIDGTFSQYVTKLSGTATSGINLGSGLDLRLSATGKEYGSFAFSVSGLDAADTKTSAGTAATAIDNAGFLAVTGTSVEEVAFTGAATSAFNNNTYTVTISDQGDGNVIFEIKDTTSNTTAASRTVSVKDWVAGMNKVDFGDFGSIGFSVAADATPEGVLSDLQTKFNGQTITMTEAGADPVVTPARGATASITLNGETVDVGLGDLSVTFRKSGVTLHFDGGLRDTDLGSAGSLASTLNGKDVVVNALLGNAMVIQTGANQGDELSINIEKMNTESLGIAGSSVATRQAASRAITEVNDAINQVSTQRAALGALQNRLGHKIANLDTSAENLTAAESRIRDVDMAKEMTNFTKQNILVQAATAMLAQANSAPQNVLSLLR